MDNFPGIVPHLTAGHEADLVSMDQGAQILIDAGILDLPQEFHILIQQRDWAEGLGIKDLFVSLGNHRDVCP